MLELLGWGTHRKQKPSPAIASPSVAHAFWSVQVTSIPWATDGPVNKTNGGATVNPCIFPSSQSEKNKSCHPNLAQDTFGLTALSVPAKESHAKEILEKRFLEVFSSKTQ